jgi:hypothetical protein
MTADLAGSRVLYLPMIGVAFFWAVLIQSCERAPVPLLLTIGLLMFQVGALLHNLSTWRQAAFLAQNTCRAAAE